MTRTRILVVDDSALFRELISEILNSKPDLEVVGVARDAQKAWQMIETLKPDVATLDVEMPGVDGVSFLRRLMQEHPIPVVMVSTLTHQSSATGIRALEAGAVDLVEKPRLDIRTRTLHMADELIEKVRGAARARVRKRQFVSPSLLPPPRALRATRGESLGHTDPAIRVVEPLRATRPTAVADTRHAAPLSSTRTSVVPPAAVPARTRRLSFGQGTATRRAVVPANHRTGSRTRSSLVAIGASTGGTEALLHVLRELPQNGPPLLIVQHMPEHFTASFAKRLDSLCAIDVREARDRDRVIRGCALIAPGGHHMRLQRSGADFIVRITDDAPVGLHRPSVDVLFESCARQAGAACMGVLLTGMGADGAYGMGELSRAGAETIAQDEHSCVVYGMPKEAIERGFAQRVLPLNRIARAIASVQRTTTSERMR